MTSLLDTEFGEGAPCVSPDGRWLAYVSDESGQAEVYGRPFPEVETGKWQVSNVGGNYPVWSPDGQELLFSTTPGGFGFFVVTRVETEPTTV